MSLKRTMTDTMERVLGVRIIRPGLVALLFEEEHLRWFFEHFLVDCVFDVGANRGQCATMLRERVGYQGFVVSFEPTPHLACELRELAQNDLHWFIDEAALDRVAGTALFNVAAHSQFSSLRESALTEVDLFRRYVAVVQHIEVSTTTVALELIKNPFLKMDTQGHDLAVAEGAAAALREFVGIQSELTIKRIYEGTPSYDEALAVLHEARFRAECVGAEQRGALSPAHRNRLHHVSRVRPMRSGSAPQDRGFQMVGQTKRKRHDRRRRIREPDGRVWLLAFTVVGGLEGCTAQHPFYCDKQPMTLMPNLRYGHRLTRPPSSTASVSS